MIPRGGSRYLFVTPTRTTLNISLTLELEEFVSSRVRSGRYQSASEVVREGLRLLQDRDAAFDEVRSKIAVGLEQALGGELLDGTEVFGELDRLDGTAVP